MRKALVLLLGVCLLALFVGSVSARDIDKNGTRAMKDEDPALIDPGLQTLMAAAAADTYCIVWFDFEQLDWQDWEQFDNTAQVDTFFHVDDFGGLEGGDYGGLYALEGVKSLWCGVRAGDSFYLCGWLAAPGYGNNWNQIATTVAFDVDETLLWSFICSFDSETDWDFTYIEFDAGDGNWTEVAHYDGLDTALVVEEEIHLSQLATKLRYHFVADGNTSDQDALWDGDGAFIVDSITVADGGGVIDYEDFESYPVGATGEYLTSLGCFWNMTIEDAYGAFTGLKSHLVDYDACGDNISAQIIFFEGSSFPSSDYPTLFDVPFCEGGGGTEAPCLDAVVVSPVIDMLMYSLNCDEVQDTPIPTADADRLGGASLRFTVYRDLPLDNLIFYTWQVRSIIDGCPGQWKDRKYVYYGADQDYIFIGQNVSDLVGALPMQVNVGVKDMCDAWYGVVGSCARHTPSPWLDNVRVYRYKTVGPSWSVRGLDLFQDTFPQNGVMEDYCRADMANDVAPNEEFDRIDPGDSVAFNCTAILAGGLDTLGTGEDKVYCHVSVEFIGPVGEKPDITGSILEGTYGSWVATAGSWDIFLCEPARTGDKHTIVPEMYMFDLNDSLFTRGYMIEYYFKAEDLNHETSTLPSSAEEADGNRFEFTCLPTLNEIPGVLFCDDFDGRGGTFEGAVQTYFEAAFEVVIPAGTSMPDRYDTRGPSSGVSNGIGAYVKADGPTSIFCIAYEKVIHDSGDLDSQTISEGTESSDKSNDAQLLVNWMDNSNHRVGLLVMGDQVAYDLSWSATAVAISLTGEHCGVVLDANSYYDETGGLGGGGVISPLITSVTGVGRPYTGMVDYYIAGGCPIINDFDILEKTNFGDYALRFDSVGTDYVGIYTDQLNPGDFPQRTVWVGHSIHVMRNAVNGTPIRSEFVKRTFDFFENETSIDYTDTELPKVYSLEQNFPNPFNPSTTIKFTLPVKGHVSLKIYNVAGQLVKTMQDGVMDVGSHDLTWDGSNNLGTSVASGVYFYKINAGDNYENMKKMVLLR